MSVPGLAGVRFGAESASMGSVTIWIPPYRSFPGSSFLCCSEIFSYLYQCFVVTFINMLSLQIKHAN